MIYYDKVINYPSDTMEFCASFFPKSEDPCIPIGWSCGDGEMGVPPVRVPGVAHVLHRDAGLSPSKTDPITVLC